MLFITLITKMSDTAEAKYKYDKSSPNRNQTKVNPERHLPHRKETTPLIKRRIWAAHNREHG